MSVVTTRVNEMPLIKDVKALAKKLKIPRRTKMNMDELIINIQKAEKDSAPCYKEKPLCGLLDCRWYYLCQDMPKI